MKKLLGLLISAAMLLVVGCVTVTKDGRPGAQSAAEEYFFDCDAPSRRMSDWHRTVVGPSVEIQGRIYLVESRFDDKSGPYAQIKIKGDDRSPLIGLRLFVSPDKPDTLQAKIGGAERTSAQEAAFAGVSSRGMYPFSVSLSKDGNLYVKIGDSQEHLQVQGFTPRVVSIACRSGNFQFSKVFIKDSL